MRNISAHPIFLMHKRNSLISKSEFLFFNKIGDINTIGWNPKNYKKLWVYNLHYFDCLNIQEGIKSNEYVSWQKLIINRCYYPLLNIAKIHNIPINIEISNEI